MWHAIAHGLIFVGLVGMAICRIRIRRIERQLGAIRRAEITEIEERTRKLVEIRKEIEAEIEGIRSCRN